MQQNNQFNANPYITHNTNTAIDQANLGLNNQNPYFNAPTPAPQDNTNLLGSFDTHQFLIGALVGVAGAYLLTNENAQKAVFKTVAKGGALFTAGIEEMKERYNDAQAELEAEREG